MTKPAQLDRAARDQDAGPERTGGMRNAGSPTPAVFPSPESMRPTLVGRDFVVSAGHPIVAQVMSEILANGGTAVDAGVAGGLLSNVVQVDMCNLGGVAPTLIRRADEDAIWCIDGVGSWGADVTLDAYLRRHDGAMPIGSSVGVVPAAFAAWCTALERFGTWRLRDVIAPAIDYARRGFPLDLRSAKAFELLGSGFKFYEGSRAIYWPHGRPPHPGEILVQEALADSLERLAAADTGTREEGIRAAHDLFYKGDMARELIAFHRETGGWLTEADMAAFQSRVSRAPSVTFRGWNVYTPGIVGQGPVMLQALGILERTPLEDFGRGSPDHLHMMAEAMKQGFAEREKYYVDPDFASITVETLLSSDHLDALRMEIGLDSVLPGAALSSAAGRGRCDTTYIAVTDAAGNVFSSMPSDTIDGAPICPALGYFVSPRGVQSRIDPAHPCAIAPNKRPRLTPAPAILHRPETGEILALGSPGGDMIVQAMVESTVDMIAFGITPQQAVESPRIATFSHPGSFYPHPAFPLRLAVEERVDPQIREELSRRGHDIYVWPAFEFDAGGISIAGYRKLDPTGVPVLVAAADPRRITYAAGR
ncbi:gamma-glutamyltransferase [Gluconacetobacter sacchari DSM 12717]|uniref:Gamma-glutamyltransferase family protein n=2 Tax=Gluconacetobacter sacchari TaxID=92759 RepID=A0A7W4NPJ8_9PROT|nr:gamma-glutamyltransferase [Gluconacetobacter sacchari]MBB2161771.1 gamma-glutamyltransferase family protein [Gluconacetobacter sacchari]GBQ20081.1 gamma-glutamyltransferase [Gluconacetobacter sacchari DSM 12717]